MSMYHLPLKKHLLYIQNHFNYVYRKDDTYYIHEPVQECQSSFNCKTRFTCSLCFKLTCEDHYNSHSEKCSGRENDKQCNQHHSEYESILKYGTCMAISILRNTKNMDTFRRLLFSHYIFRRAVLEDKICRKIFIGSMSKKSMRARIIKGIRRADGCNNSRCKQKKIYCLNCARLFCVKHIENHNVCGNKDGNICAPNADGNIRCAIYHSNKNGIFRDVKEKVITFMNDWDNETLIRALNQKYQLISNIDLKKYTPEVFSCIWKQNKHLAYMLLDKTKRTSQMYIEVLNYVNNVDSPSIDHTIFDLSSLLREQINEDAVKSWIETDKSRKCGTMLSFNFVNENHLKLAVLKDYRNIEYVPKDSQTKDICLILEQSDRTSEYLSWCNIEIISENYAMNYIEYHGNYNEVIYSRIQKQFSISSCNKALEKFKVYEQVKKNNIGRRGGLGGGLMSLVAYGAQDVYLTEDINVIPTLL